MGWPSQLGPPGHHSSGDLSLTFTARGHGAARSSEGLQLQGKLSHTVLSIWFRWCFLGALTLPRLSCSISVNPKGPKLLTFFFLDYRQHLQKIRRNEGGGQSAAGPSAPTPKTPRGKAAGGKTASGKASTSKRGRPKTHTAGDDMDDDELIHETPSKKIKKEDSTNDNMVDAFDL